MSEHVWRKLSSIGEATVRALWDVASNSTSEVHARWESHPHLDMVIHGDDTPFYFLRWTTLLGCYNAAQELTSFAEHRHGIAYDLVLPNKRVTELTKAEFLSTLTPEVQLMKVWTDTDNLAWRIPTDEENPGENVFVAYSEASATPLRFESIIERTAAPGAQPELQKALPSFQVILDTYVDLVVA